MLDIVLQFDKQLFHVLNGTIVSDFTDTFFTILTSVQTIWPLYLLLAIFLLYKFRLTGVYALLSLALTLGIMDQVSTHILKPWFARERPCRQETELRLLVPCGPGQSFPSTHAVNNACLAIFLSILFPMLRIPIVIFAFLISYSRIYVGVHYPLDVFGGIIIGAVFGFASAKILDLALRKFQKQTNIIT